MLLIGGNSPQDDIDDFIRDGAHIITATPGKLEDVFKKKQAGFDLAASIKSLEVLVLDEADRLLDMGFKASLNTILSYLPKQRRTGLFSATQTQEVEALIRAGLRNPVRITVKEKADTDNSNIQRTPSSLKNYYLICESDEKFNYLVNFLRCHKDEKHMVFFSTCACVDYFTRALSEIIKHTDVMCIHGKMKEKRKKIFAKFKDRNSGILVCTDVMARGIDIPDVNWVLQYDPPSSACAFVHRCGRTARMGNIGNALLFLLPAEDTFVDFIKINQKVPLEEWNKSENVPDVLEKLKKLAMKDRAIFEGGMRAFVSFIQAYGKHECSLIFKMKDLDIAKLGRGFSLLKLPKMPELKSKSFPDFEEAEIDTTKIPFRDKTREKARLKLLEDIKLNGPQKVKRKMETVSWSKQKEKKDKRKARKAKKLSNKRPAELSRNDLDDLDSDIRLMKKLKKGKISKEDFDKEFEDEQVPVNPDNKCSQ
ncbi:ATP-dependent RNA helicase DDX55-like isoform X2 [Tubulanus polymorphus]